MISILVRNYILFFTLSRSKLRNPYWLHGVNFRNFIHFLFTSPCVMYRLAACIWIYLSSRLAISSYCWRFLRHICVCSTPTEPTCNYVERTLEFLGDSALSCRINSLNKASMLIVRTRWLATCCYFNHRRLPTGCRYTISFTRILSTSGMCFRRFPFGAARWIDCSG